MGKEAKNITFSEKDLLFIADSDFLRTKKVITRKVERLLIETEATLKPLVQTAAPLISEGLLVQGGKISRGENYLDLPYQVLDYPRLFSKEATFSYRTMFWWGNFFSCTLHIQGKLLHKFKSRLCKTLPEVDRGDVYFCINDSPWEYHYEASNYLKVTDIADIELQSLIRERGFIKLSRKLPLHQYRMLPQFSLETIEVFYELLLSEDEV